MEQAVQTESQNSCKVPRSFDPQALAAIYDLHSPGLFRYAMRRLGDVSLAEDCLSETFSRFRVATPLRTWSPGSPAGLPLPRSPQLDRGSLPQGSRPG